MLETNNNIIIVDDQERDLRYLSNVFCEYGIGCRTFLYDEFATPRDPLENVKLAFFDITLTDAGGYNAQMALLRDALKSYISVKNKAFVLVFWTNRPEYKNDFIQFVNRAEDRNEIPKPICIETIDKNEFLDNPDELRQRLTDLMDEKIVKCLFSFDTELKQASDKSLNEILNQIDFPDVWGENQQYIDNIRTVFALIAKETFGKERAKKLPDLAIKEAFGPLFLHHLCKQNSTVWSDFFEDTKITEICHFPEASIAAKLNTVFHLDLSDGDGYARGCVRQIEKDKTEVDELFKDRVGCTINEWIKTVLLRNKDFQGSIKEVIAVEISAACDYSNQKERTHQFLLGVIISSAMHDKFKKISTGDAIVDLQFAFMYEGEECCMFLHSTFLITEEENACFKLLGKRLFTLKNEVMNMIGDRHARHIARIGINSFR